jgi:translation initiation factor IF-2
LGLIPEEWGGTTQFVEVSALQKKGIPELFDAILAAAEVLDLKANFDRLAEGKIIESRNDQGRGIVSTNNDSEWHLAHWRFLCCWHLSWQSPGSL